MSVERCYGYLYRVYDADGALLYIGSTVSVPERIHQHLRSDWQSSAAGQAELRARIHRVEVEALPTIAQARAAERQAIRDEAPELNRAHNPKRWRFGFPSFTPVPYFAADSTRAAS